MTAEEKVKQVYPKASCSPRCQVWQIWSGIASPEIGLLGTAHRESWAWADAWRRIQKAKESNRES